MPVKLLSPFPQFLEKRPTRLGGMKEKIISMLNKLIPMEMFIKFTDGSVTKVTTMKLITGLIPKTIKFINVIDGLIRTAISMKLSM